MYNTILTSSDEDSSSDELLSALAFLRAAGCFFTGAVTNYVLSKIQIKNQSYDIVLALR